MAYPDISLPLPTFAAFAAARADSWRGNLARAEDLYLACACAGGVPDAAEAFIQRFGGRIHAYLGRLATSDDLVAEVRQIVTVRCLIGDGDRPPAIADYTGLGSLDGWVRATAVREALALVRSAARNTASFPDEQRLAERLAEADRELALLASAYREHVSRAFAAAAAELPRAHRTLLRLHYVHGLTTAQLATMYHTSRATLIRRLADAREALVELVQRALRDSAGVTAQEFESVLRLVKSQLDLRLSVVLRESPSA